jgi:hypothetical protein
MNRRLMLIIDGVVAAALLMSAAMVAGALSRTALHLSLAPAAETSAKLPSEKALRASLRTLQTRLSRLVPRDYHMVINTTANTFELRKAEQVVRSGICATGSSILLKSPDKREWIFSTPRGRFTILTKLVDPVWRRPDWAFVEEGKNVPHKNSPERFERGVLGDYAMTLGQGYMIHGTLYQRFLGLPVTHGCVRMGDEDLKVVYGRLSVGSKVFIF